MGEITSSGQAATMLGEITSSGQAATMMPVDNDREETPLKSTNSPATSICNNSESLVSLPRMTTTPVEILELQHTATDPTQDENVLTSTNSPATSICNNNELMVSLPRTPTTPFGKLELQHTATNPTEDEIVEKLKKLKRNFKEASEYLQSIGWTITATPRRNDSIKKDYNYFFKEAPENVLRSIPKVIEWYSMKSKGVVAADPNVYHESLKNQDGRKKRVKKG